LTIDTIDTCIDLSTTSISDMSEDAHKAILGQLHTEEIKEIGRLDIQMGEDAPLRAEKVGLLREFIGLPLWTRGGDGVEGATEALPLLLCHTTDQLTQTGVSLGSVAGLSRLSQEAKRGSKAVVFNGLSSVSLDDE